MAESAICVLMIPIQKEDVEYVDAIIEDKMDGLDFEAFITVRITANRFIITL